MSEHFFSADDRSPAPADDLVLHPPQIVALDPAYQRRALDTLVEPLAGLPDCNGAEALRSSSGQLGGFLVGAGLGARRASIPVVAAQRITDRAESPTESPADPVADPASNLRIGDLPALVPAGQGGLLADDGVADSLALCR